MCVCVCIGASMRMCVCLSAFVRGNSTCHDGKYIHATMTTNTSIWQNTHVTMTTNTSIWQNTRHDDNIRQHGYNTFVTMATTHTVTITYIHVNTATEHTHTLIWPQCTHRDDNTHINMAATHTSIWQQYIRQDDNIHVNMSPTGTS